MRLLTVVFVASMMAQPAAAHIDAKCAQLFTDAGNALQPVLRKGEEADDRAWAGVTNGWGEHRADMLADSTFQLIGHLSTFMSVMGAAVNCVNGVDGQ